MLTLSPASASRPDKVFVLTNENNTDFTNFQWSFHVVWKGDIDYGPPVRTSTPAPTGTCQLVTDFVTGNRTFSKDLLVCVTVYSQKFRYFIIAISLLFFIVKGAFEICLRAD